METKRRASRAATAAGLVLACCAGAARSEPPGRVPPAGAPTVVRGVVVTGLARPKPGEAPPPLSDYVQPPRIEQIALSPDGEQVAFVTTLGGVRVLITYRIADRTPRVVKLDSGEISAISWADKDHVLLTASRSALRGTCNAGDEPAIQVNVINASVATQDAIAQYAAGSAEAGDAESNANAFSSEIGGPPCVYYGVRVQSAVTSVDVAKRRGRGLGGQLGDLDSRPLGAPVPAEIKSKARLVGPFLELRKLPMNGEPAERVYLWSINPATGAGDMMDDHGGDLDRTASYVDDWLVTRKGEIAARSAYQYGNGRYSIQMRDKGAWKPVLTRAISAKSRIFAPYLIGLGQTPGSVVVLDGADGPGGRAFHFYDLSAQGALSGPLEPDDAARDRPLFDAAGRVAGFARQGLVTSYDLTQPALSDLYQDAQNAAPGEDVRVVSTADDPRRMVIYAEGRQDPGAYYLIDFSTGTSATIGEDYPQVPTPWVGSQSRISYTASDGLQIDALLTLPPEPKAHDLPLVVLPHDGPEAHDRAGFDWLAQALASRGYLVLQPQYRGSDGDGPALMRAGWGQLGRKMQTDLADGARELVREGLADPRRVCILGVGFGGYAAMVAAATDSGTWRCAASIDGISDPEAFVALQKKRQLVAGQDEITPLLADPAHRRAFRIDPYAPQVLARYIGPDGAPSPVKLAGSISIPVLLVHQSNDPVAPVRQSRALRDALKAAGKPVQLVEVKGKGDHEVGTVAARLAVLDAVLDFLARNDPAG